VPCHRVAPTVYSDFWASWILSQILIIYFHAVKLKNRGRGPENEEKSTRNHIENVRQVCTALGTEKNAGKE
jgi:hypothetical protein